MKQIKKILVPTDFSEHSIAAYKHAQQIAKQFGAKIDLVHIIPTLKYFHESISQLGAPISMESDLYPKIQEETTEKLQEIMEEHFDEEHRGETIRQIERTASSKICDIAERGGYDLIVMASKGEHGTNLLRGSTTEKVVRHSRVPVFTVDTDLTSESLKRILLPSDGSDISFSALPIALSLADIYDAEIILFHVIELYGDPLQSEAHNPKMSDEQNIYTKLIDHLEDFLASSEFDNVGVKRHEDDFKDEFVVTEGASTKSINMETIVKKGVSAHLAIEDYANENADVVVMATHGHTGLAHFFLGSTTEKVTQHLTIPVLTVKPAKKKLKERD